MLVIRQTATINKSKISNSMLESLDKQTAIIYEVNGLNVMLLDNQKALAASKMEDS